MLVEDFRAQNCKREENTFLGSLDAQRRAHDTLYMSSHAAHTAMTATFDDIATVTTPASPAEVQEAIPRLPDHLVVEHVLRAEYFDDPADLARLPAVSRAMRDAVAATGLRFKEFDEYGALKLGCLSALQRLQRQGRLSREEHLCQAAARSGQLEELKALRADGCPWTVRTCCAAATGGHLEVLQWARANGAPWDAETFHGRGEMRALRGAAVVARERLPVGHSDVRARGEGRVPRGAAVGARERVPVGQGDVLVCGEGRAPRDASVGARERLPVGQEDVRVGEIQHRTTKMGDHERLPPILIR